MFILELKLNTSKSDEAILNKRFNIALHMTNTLIKFAKTHINALKNDYKYIKYIKLYHSTNDKILKKEYSNELNNLIKNYKLTKSDFEEFIKIQQHIFKKNIDSQAAQKISLRVYKAVEKVLYSTGKTIHFKKELDSIEGKQNSTGIKCKNLGKDSYTSYYLDWNGLNIPITIVKNDYYAYEALENNIKYCRIVKKAFNDGYHYYIQLILEGMSPIKHTFGKDTIGIDPGTSTMAIVSDTKAILTELASNINTYNKEITRLNKKLDNKKRINNPNNYNTDGTIKKNSKYFKRKWKKSGKYRALSFKLKRLYRQKSAYIKQSHNILANEILSLGTNIYCEKMNYTNLTKKSKKETTKSTKTITTKSGKVVLKNKKKKRFGKSINNRAPSLLLTLLDSKLSYQGLKINYINTKTFKASQYNHIEDTYIKKELKQRWNEFNYKGNILKIQRDLYSAYLIRNSKKDLKSTDRKECIKGFDNFIKIHNIEIENIKLIINKRPSSFGF